jgi:hypothetical protein
MELLQCYTTLPIPFIAHAEVLTHVIPLPGDQLGGKHGSDGY